MVQWQDSPHGKLQWDGTGWATANNFLPLPSHSTTNCCRWVSTKIKNCYLYFMPLFQQDIPPKLRATGANLPTSCEYKRGKCQLNDGRFVVWKPVRDSQINCFYPMTSEPIAGFEVAYDSNGYTNSLWVSSDGSKTAHFDIEHPVQGYDCQKAKSPVVTPLLDALADQYVQLVDVQATCANFSTAFGISLFHTTYSLMYQAYHQMSAYISRVNYALRTSPTSAVRVLSQKDNLLAFSTSKHVHMQYCFVVKKGQYQIIVPPHWFLIILPKNSYRLGLLIITNSTKVSWTPN